MMSGGNGISREREKNGYTYQCAAVSQLDDIVRAGGSVTIIPISSRRFPFPSGK